MMNKDYYKKLTLAVYKVTDLFPEGEPLKWQIRELANKVLADLILTNPSPEGLLNKRGLFKNMKILNSFFEVAQAQGWLDDRNFLVLQQEYNKVQRFIDDKPIPVKPAEEKVAVVNNGGQGRQEKILNILKEKKSIRIGELSQSFPQVSRRTIIRDLEGLYRSGVVIRSGSGRGAHYNVKM